MNYRKNGEVLAHRTSIHSSKFFTKDGEISTLKKNGSFVRNSLLNDPQKVITSFTIFTIIEVNIIKKNLKIEKYIMEQIVQYSPNGTRGFFFEKWLFFGKN